MKKLLTNSLVILLVMVCFGVQVSHAATIPTDDFESYSVTTLGGTCGGTNWQVGLCGAGLQDDWTSSDTSVVASPAEGTRAVQFAGTGQSAARKLDITTTSGVIHVSMYATSDAAADETSWLLEDSAVGTAFRVKMISDGAGGDITLVGATTQVICSFVTYTWYDVNVTFDTASTGTITANCDGGTETSAVAEQNAVDLVNSFYMYDQNNAGGVLDSICPPSGGVCAGGGSPPPPPSLPMPLWMRILHGISQLVINVAHAEVWNDTKDAFIGELQGRIKFEKAQGNTQKVEELQILYGQATATPNKDFDSQKEQTFRSSLPDDTQYRDSKVATSTVGNANIPVAVASGGVIGFILLILTWLGLKKKELGGDACLDCGSPDHCERDCKI